MKTNAFLICVLLLLCVQYSVFSQGFQTPSSGKCVVYFIRPEFFDRAVKFEYYDNDRYIGGWSGINYMRYECDPGTHLFWATSENKEFMPSELKAGGVYMVNVFAVYGFGKAHVQLSPLPPNNSALLNQNKNFIKSKASVYESPDKIEKINAKKRKFIEEMLNKYKTEWKDKHNFHQMTADMAIPEDALK
jgi:hypothetical protein